jgi:hypothetical protein
MAKARVSHIPVLKDVKASLLEFIESVATVLTSVDADVGRVTQWLHQERPGHWKSEIRKRTDAVARARQEVERKRLIAHPNPADVTLEKRAVERAKERLAEAERRLKAVQKWGPVWEKQALMYKSSCHGLNQSLHADLPSAAARLERMLRSLEEYTQLVAPAGDEGRAPDAGHETEEPGEPGGTPADHSAIGNPQSEIGPPPDAAP